MTVNAFDTIAAIATAPGAAGLAVVRVSGPEAIAVAARVFEGHRPLVETPSHTLQHGWAVAGSEASRARIDEVVAAVFRAPRSYTCEDVVELSCHGGAWPARRVLDALIEAGARLARPGEFSFRAFVNGRIDLSQAEAVADVIHAETSAAHSLALAQLAGGLSQRLRAIAERLADVLAEIEARVDFAEDVGGVEVPERAYDEIETALAELGRLLESAAYARAVREGARVPIVGRPNAGKSSIFNALVGEDRAIVAATPGTTRDRVSESIEIEGIRIVLSDTAGLRDGDEAIERLGIERSERFLEESPAVVWVIDGSGPLRPEDVDIARRLAGKRAVVAINKLDLGARVTASDVDGLWITQGHADGNGSGPSTPSARDARSREAATGRESRTAIASAAPEDLRVVAVSALRGEGLDALRLALLDMLAGSRDRSALSAATGNPRHIEAVARARAALERAARIGRSGEPGEIVAIELREAIDAIGEVTGQNVREDLIDRIFARFCVGK
jgi:tRNA modification GTPase